MSTLMGHTTADITNLVFKDSLETATGIPVGILCLQSERLPDQFIVPVVRILPAPGKLFSGQELQV